MRLHEIISDKPFVLKRRWLPFVFLCVLLLFLGLFIVTVYHPIQVSQLDNLLFNTHQTNLLPYLEYAVTDNDTLGLTQEIRDDASFRTPLDENELYFGDEQQAVWLRFKLQDIPGYQSSVNHVVFFDDMFFTEWWLYVPVEINGLIDYWVNTRHDLQVKNAVLPYEEIVHNSSVDQYCYIRYQRENIAHRLLFSNQDSFFETQIRLIIFMVACMGFLLGMIVLNLMLAFSTRVHHYLWHTGFLLCAYWMLYMLSSLTQWVDGHIYSELAFQLQLFTILACGYFCYGSLNIGKQRYIVPVLYKVVFGLGTLMALRMLFFPTQQLLRIQQVYGVVMLAFIALVASLLFLKGRNVTLRFLVGLFLAIFSTLISFLSMMGMIPLSYITSYLMFPAYALEAMLFSSGITHMIHEREKVNRVLQDEINRDALTGLKNRHYLDAYARSIAFTQDKQPPSVCMLMFDIDNFKSVNDTYGHDVGDTVLVTLAQLAMAHFRNTDAIIRWGGEEFAVILPATALKEAMEIGERFRRQVDSATFNKVGHLTISLGVAERAPLESFDPWFKRTDKAMYTAKHTGRNRLVLSYPLLNERQALVTIPWETTYACGNSTIDTQHQHLLSTVNDLLIQWYSGHTKDRMMAQIDQLLTDVAAHFSDEEQILLTLHYPYLDEHRIEHKRLTSHATALTKAVRNGKIDVTQLLEMIVGELVVGHMRQEDVLYYAFIAQQQSPNGAQSDFTESP